MSGVRYKKMSFSPRIQLGLDRIVNDLEQYNVCDICDEDSKRIFSRRMREFRDKYIYFADTPSGKIIAVKPGYHIVRTSKSSFKFEPNNKK